MMGFSLIRHPGDLKHTCSSMAAFLKQLPLWEQDPECTFQGLERGVAKEPPIAPVQLASQMAVISSPWPPQHQAWFPCSSQSQGWTQHNIWQDPEISIWSWDAGFVRHSAELSDTKWVFHLLTGKRSDYDVEPNSKRYFLGVPLGISYSFRKTVAWIGILNNQTFALVRGITFSEHLLCGSFVCIVSSYLLNKTPQEVFLVLFTEEENELREFNWLFQGRTKDNQDLKQTWNSDKIYILSLTSC